MCALPLLCQILVFTELYLLLLVCVPTCFDLLLGILDSLELSAGLSCPVWSAVYMTLIKMFSFLDQLGSLFGYGLDT